MKLLTIIASLVIVVAILPATESDFDQFLRDHNKVYTSKEEYTRRFTIYSSNIEAMNKHNAQGSFQVGVTQFTDMEAKEAPRGYKYKDKGNRFEFHKGEAPHWLQSSAVGDVDWRAKGAVSPIRNQGQGETCWSFSTAGAVEGGRVAQAKQTLVPLSNQYVIDCMDIPCANSSGTMDDAFKWLATQNSGQMYSWATYPYIDANCIFWDPPHDCQHNDTLVSGADVTGMHHTIVSNETDLMLAVQVQPVSVGIYSGAASFTTYTSGIYSDKDCENVTPDMLDHAVLVVGYGTSNGEDYWLVKNSWGTTWGMEGFFMMARNKGNMCGIAIDASYPSFKLSQ